MNDTAVYLAPYGARSAQTVLLDDKDDPRLLPYLDLTRARSTVMPDAVVEHEGRPLLYVVRTDRLGTEPPTPAEVRRLRKSLAMRGEDAHVGLLRPGVVELYTTHLKPPANQKPVIIEADGDMAPALVPRLAQGEDLAARPRSSLREIVFRLMKDAVQELRDLDLDINETIVLTGRALFFRYLVGRRIVGPERLRTLSPSAASLEEALSDWRAAAATNRWLTDTFNGDLLPLPSDDLECYFRRLHERSQGRVFRPLAAILGLDQPVAPGASQRRLPLGWADLEFDHIPVGLMSQVYEELMEAFSPGERASTSVYYTPWYIAEYMVDEAFHNLPAGHAARVLDPAAGAGVFLVAVLRKLVALRWEADRRQPDRGTVLEILKQQVVGFETNRSGRTLAALALYLTTLELDPEPSPAEALRFPKLGGKVLVDVSDPDTDPDLLAPSKGSLGEHVDPKHRGRYDLVIGNPPWKELGRSHGGLAKLYTGRVRQVAKERGLSEIAESYENPHAVPDLPFVWAAMQWAKPGASIALALHARLLFAMASPMVAARRALFTALRVTGVLNGAELRETPVWPGTRQPFCLLFSRNEIPSEDEQFLMVSPRWETTLNNKGRMRVDAEDAEPIGLAHASREPGLLKVLFRCGSAGVDVLARLKAGGRTTVGELWLGVDARARGKGYQVGNRRKDASFLHGLPNLTTSSAVGNLRIDARALRPFDISSLEAPRSGDLYRAPLVLVREHVLSNRDEGVALFSADDLAFSKSFYGYSTASFRNPEATARLLFLVINSRVFRFYCLAASGKFGVERDAIDQRDIDTFPFPDVDNLDTNLQEELQQLSELLLKSAEKPWHEVDRFVARLYGLSRWDMELIRDTLDTRTPFPEARDRADEPPTDKEVDGFAERLAQELSPFFDATGRHLAVFVVPQIPSLPWRFIVVQVGRRQRATTGFGAAPQEWLEALEDYGTTRVVRHPAPGILEIGILARYRYWTPTRARLLAANILREHGRTLEEAAA